jgi:hypothetical protein
MMASAGINPTNVLFVRISNEEVYQRTLAGAQDDFECNRSIVANRLRYCEANQPQVLGFFQRFYNSVVEIDGHKSMWYMEDVALQAIQDTTSARQQFAKNLCLSAPCSVQDLHYDRCLMKASLSQFGYFCPVTWKNTKQLIKCVHNPETSLFYNNVFYYFRGLEERQMFLDNTRRFINNVIFSSAKGIPIRFKQHKASEIMSQEKALMGHCPVTLVDEGRVIKGDQLLIVHYKDNKYAFENESKL